MFINNWEKTALKLPSIVRVHKLATLEKGMVLIYMGEIDKEAKSQVKALISKLTD